MKATKGRLLVLNALTTGSLTDFELAARTGWQQTSIGKRRGECRDAGLIEAAEWKGQPIRRPSPSGSMSQVWRLTTAGVDYLKTQ
jgi:hypothetical protein